MIPLKLQLKNFLSYGAEIQTIDFAPYNLICLSGKNGHGKSALLDAITWALWGHARKIQGVAKADHALLRLGQKSMMVSLDFAFDGQLYRVRREFALTHGKPYVALDIGIIDEKEDAVVSLTDKTMRATQAKINTLIGLDFDAFINSAFLRQGQANEFSKKSSKERKEILASILGLHRFEGIRKLALEKARTASSDKDQYQKLQERLDQEVAKTQQLQLQIIEVEKKIALQTQEEQKVQCAQTELEKKKKELNKQREKRKLLQFQHEQKNKQLTQEYQNVCSLVHQWRTTHQQQLNLPDRTELEKQKATIATNIEKQQTTLHKSLEIKQQYLNAKEQEQNLLQQLTQAHMERVQEKKINIQQLIATEKNNTQTDALLTKNLSTETKELATIIKQISAQETVLTKQAVDQKVLQQLEKQFDKRRAFYHQYVAQGNLLKAELDGIEQKKQLIHDPQNPSCPLCEQNLSASRKRFLQGRFVKNQSSLQHRLTRIARLLKKLKTVLLTQHKELEAIKKNTQELVIVQANIEHQQKEKEKTEQNINARQQELKEKKEELKQLSKQIAHAKKELANKEKEHETSLQKNSDYQAIKKELAALQKQEQKYQYDPKKHAQCKQQLATIEQQLKLHTGADQQAMLQEKRKQDALAICQQLRNIKQETANLDKQLQKFNDLAPQEKTLEKEEQSLLEQKKELDKGKNKLMQEKGSLLNQKDKLTAIEQELRHNKKAMQKLTNTMHDYQEIGKALSKDGIQALLIEDAIPEIEQEANELLAKLTDNQSQIFIESLRDLKKGGTKETLDIKISDAAGLRSYELFSGGEAFRIDFALRIAISKLLARRAGASLQTLIIDEGFGSQDEDGLAHIMDAIYKIQDDFTKIIIVSHLTSMQDQFPVHFMVQKSATGSTVNVIEQG